MIVAMEKITGEIAAKLSRAGHRIVPLYGYNGVIDAVLYYSSSVCQRPLTAQNFGADGEGIFMLCIENMSADSVLTALETKSYSRIF